MAADEKISSAAEFREAFLANERQVRISTGKLACALVFVLMPFGVTLDYFVYPDQLLYFFELRLLCSALVAVVWALHWTPLARRHYPLVGLPIVLLPTLFMTLMIYKMDAVSPYYAGLNLVLLAVSAVGHWSFKETLVAVMSVICMYLCAYVLKEHGHAEFRFFFNNAYFLLLTGIIVCSGNYVFNGLRFREFVLRYELDQNRKQLSETNQKLMELDQIKGRFFANISHELRTPLTLMISPLETMLNQPGRQIDSDSRNLMTIMHGNGLRLLKLINDLLDLVRLESGRMEVKREPIEVISFVRGMIGAANQMAQTKGLSLETDVEAGLGAILLDRDKLEKTILNLVFNALKFTPKGGRVTLKVQLAEQNVIFTVTDTGVGIAAKNLPFVFDRFWQADNSSKRKYQGVGIGLSLVKELTEIQGGSVAVASEEGKGTSFTVRLPLLRPDPNAEPIIMPEPAAPQPSTPQEAAPAPLTAQQSEEWLSNLYRRAELFPGNAAETQLARPTAEKNGALPTLLVADDEPDMLRFLKSQLQTRYHVVEAVDGAQAVERALGEQPDIMLLDMNMPEKDGLQVCRELRAQPATREVPIIILTARADEPTKLAVLSAGANDFLTKPFSSSELHVRIKNLVESSQFRQQLARQNKTLESTIELLKQTESLLVQNEKMVSLGRMSAGIIHEINNPLNYATTGLYSLRQKARHVVADQQPEYAEILKDVEDGINRVRDIVTDLQTFTHPNTEQVDEVEVREILDQAMRFLSNEWKDRVRIELAIDSKLSIFGNRNKVLQVFVNLLQNSLDALAKKQFKEEQPTIWIAGTREGEKALIQVRDNGLGIPPEVVDKIFDPFFTTKAVGEGMGLGLSICYRIVRDYGGQIQVRSEPGKYCEFRLEFKAQR